MLGAFIVCTLGFLRRGTHEEAAGGDFYEGEGKRFSSAFNLAVQAYRSFVKFMELAVGSWRALAAGRIPQLDGAVA
jgi:hypothetical protein